MGRIAMKTITVTELRGNIYKLLDEVLNTGIPIEIKKGGKKLKIVPVSDRIGLKVCDKSLNTIVSGALNLSWTRDPFDRIIVANASVNNDILVTKDQNILKNYKKAMW